jgi:hypothetical protein
MSAEPPSNSGKYRMAQPEPPVIARRVTLPPPRKIRPGHWEALFRVVIVLVMLVSVAVAYWSFFHRLQPLQKQARSVVTKASGLSAQLDEMERRWTPEQVEDIRARYREVYQQLFNDQAALEQWLGQIQTQAAPLALDINVSFGPGRPQEGFAEQLAVIPTSISLEVQPALGAKGKTPYERVLQFGQQLAGHGKRADLAELNVTGGTGSIGHALLVFNLWVGDLGQERAAPAASAPRTTKRRPRS